jgi:hypothetical protein
MYLALGINGMLIERVWTQVYSPINWAQMSLNRRQFRKREVGVSFHKDRRKVALAIDQR